MEANLRRTPKPLPGASLRALPTSFATSRLERPLPCTMTSKTAFGLLVAAESSDSGTYAVLFAASACPARPAPTQGSKDEQDGQQHGELLPLAAPERVAPEPTGGARCALSAAAYVLVPHMSLPTLLPVGVTGAATDHLPPYGAHAGERAPGGGRASLDRVLLPFGVRCDQIPVLIWRDRSPVRGAHARVSPPMLRVAAQPLPLLRCERYSDTQSTPHRPAPAGAVLLAVGVLSSRPGPTRSQWRIRHRSTRRTGGWRYCSRQRRPSHSSSSSSRRATSRTTPPPFSSSRPRCSFHRRCSRSSSSSSTSPSG